MHARVTTIEMDPSRIDEAISEIEGTELPSWRDIEGFRGFTLLADRASGKVIGTSYWESETQMDASEDQLKGSRQRAAETGGASSAPQVERFAVALDTFER